MAVAGELLTPVSGCETGTSVLGEGSIFPRRLCGEKHHLFGAASVVFGDENIPAGGAPPRVSLFLDGAAVHGLGASAKQIILLLYYTSIAQTGWNIEQSEEINQHRRPQAQEEKARHQRPWHCSHMHTHIYIIYHLQTCVYTHVQMHA